MENDEVFRNELFEKLQNLSFSKDIRPELEIELVEITDENRIKFFGEAESPEVDIPYSQEAIEQKSLNESQSFWEKLSESSMESDPQKSKLLYKGDNQKLQNFFPITTGVPDDILVVIATLLLPETKDLISISLNGSTNNQKMVYKNIATFLRTCKKFYSLKKKIEPIVWKNLYKVLNPLLQVKLFEAQKNNPSADIAHIAVVYEDIVWLTYCILKNKNEPYFYRVINTEDTLYRTPLHWAAYYNKTQIINMLVKCGANIESKDFLGNTPLHMTTFRGSINAAKALLELGANPNSKNQKLRSPLHEVAIKDNDLMVKLLLDFNAKVDCKDIIRRTPLHEAALSNSWRSAAYLIMKKASVNRQDNSGDTPLHLAALRGHEKVALCLLNHGALNTIENLALQKPTDKAREKKHRNLVELIKRKNNDCNIN